MIAKRRLLIYDHHKACDGLPERKNYFDEGVGGDMHLLYRFGCWKRGFYQKGARRDQKSG